MRHPFAFRCCLADLSVPRAGSASLGLVRLPKSCLLYGSKNRVKRISPNTFQKCRVNGNKLSSACQMIFRRSKKRARDGFEIRHRSYCEKRRTWGIREKSEGSHYLFIAPPFLSFFLFVTRGQRSRTQPRSSFPPYTKYRFPEGLSQG